MAGVGGIVNEPDYGQMTMLELFEVIQKALEELLLRMMEMAR